MRRAPLAVGAAFSLAAVVTLGARLAVVTGTALSVAGCSKCELEITTSDPLPDGRVGRPYFVQMEAGSSHCSSYWWGAVTATVPPGMKVSQGGALDGVPTEAGTYSVEFFVMEVDFTDAPGSDSTTVYRRYTLTILP